MTVVCVVVSGNFNEFISRRLPVGATEYMDCTFVPYTEGVRADWVVVLHFKAHRETIRVECDPTHVVFISMEPVEDRSVSRGYLDQFTTVVVTDPRVTHERVIRSNGVSWWVGKNVDHDGRSHMPGSVERTFDQLSGAELPNKRDRVSVVTSTREWMPGHAWRNRFIDAIQRHPIGRHVDIFGGGRVPIVDKWDAIAPYKYHIALENCSIPDYWTEKLADSFLAFALPLYWGCTNIEEYFDSDSFVQLEILDPINGIQLIESVLDEDPYEAHLPKIIESRNSVLQDYNLLTIISGICRGHGSEHTRIELLPSAHFRKTPLPMAWRRVKSGIYRNTRTWRIGSSPLWTLPP